jgi:GNAT superfamily N-acetyltransferase
MLPSAMMLPIAIERIGKDAAESDIRGLAQVLLDAIGSNAGVSFMPGLTQEEAEAWWRSVVAADRAIVLVARDGDGVVGTVQIQPSWAPNQPHRGDVAKLIVHGRARRRGIGRALMEALEMEARAAGYTLLLLDTRKDDHPERLYASMGWVRVGEVPDFALNPDGSMCTTVFYYKQLADAHRTTEVHLKVDATGIRR